jgi:tetratricopeptide (TPR) repeat protein
MTTPPPDFAGAVARLTAAIQQAHALEQSRQVDAAQAAYQACLATAQAHEMIQADQLFEIWMGLGFCQADRNDWPGALAWYGRAEALVLSAPSFNADPQSAAAQANAQRWAPHLPDGVRVMFVPGTMGKDRLAACAESTALAYDKSGQPDQAGASYQRALDLYRELGSLRGETSIWWYQAAGSQQRKDWEAMIEAASQMLLVAERAQDAGGQLEARRLLTHAHVNQRRFFRVLEHLTEVVRLARQLGDARLPVEEGLLRDAIAQVRPAALERGQAILLHLLVEAEALLDHPNLALDRALLEEWKNRPAVAELVGLEQVGSILEQWALRHCGPANRSVQPARTGLGKLFGKPAQPEQRPVWQITYEDMQLYQKTAEGALRPYQAPCAVLNLYGPRESIISVGLPPGGCQIMVMELRQMQGLPPGQYGYVSVAHADITPSAELLAGCLDAFIQRGLFVRTTAGLQYVGPGR